MPVSDPRPLKDVNRIFRVEIWLPDVPLDDVFEAIDQNSSVNDLSKIIANFCDIGFQNFVHQVDKPREDKVSLSESGDEQRHFKLLSVSPSVNQDLLFVHLEHRDEPQQTTQSHHFHSFFNIGSNLGTRRLLTRNSGISFLPVFPLRTHIFTDFANFSLDSHLVLFFLMLKFTSLLHFDFVVDSDCFQVSLLLLLSPDARFPLA